MIVRPTGGARRSGLSREVLPVQGLERPASHTITRSPRASYAIARARQIEELEIDGDLAD